MNTIQCTLSTEKWSTRNCRNLSSKPTEMTFKVIQNQSKPLCGKWSFRVTQQKARPCCPANFFVDPDNGLPTAPPDDAPACVQRLSLHGLRCLQRFHKKHQHQHDALVGEEALAGGLGLICFTRCHFCCWSRKNINPARSAGIGRSEANAVVDHQ